MSIIPPLSLKMPLDFGKRFAARQRTLNEAHYKRTLVAEVRSLPNGYARRLEDRFAVGLLDLILMIPGLPIIFAEGKIVEGQAFAPTDRQYLEGERIQGAGATVLLIGWKDKLMAVSPWTKQAKWGECHQGLNRYSTIVEYYRELGRHPAR
jgi:hypothetical protein